MRVDRLWRCASVILVPDIGVSSRINTDEKSLRAFEVGRLERMASDIIDVILIERDIWKGYIADNIFP